MEETWNVLCPYCGQSFCVFVDLSAGDQEYVEDCQVCCQPIDLRVRIKNGEIQDIRSKRSDE